MSQKNRFPIYIGDNAITELIAYLRARQLNKMAMVVDENTYPALGQRVEQALRAAAFDLNVVHVHGRHGDNVVADEVTLIDVITKARRDEQVYLAIGGGTITDITRFSSYVSRAPFISLPTAPSVDGFTSLGAPLVIQGLKKTLICQAPLALFADLPTLCAAPQAMLAAGFGDMIGKINSATDWQLGHLLYDEAYDDEITRRYFATALNCAEHAEGIGTRDREAIKVLMESLIESGFGMMDFGNSNPASGAEHHLSHYWEMRLLISGRKARLHGAKVGAASVMTAQWFRELAALSREDLAERLAQAHLPNAAQEETAIRHAYPGIAETLIKEQQEFLHMPPERFTQIKQRLLDQWDDIRAALQAVPAPEQLAQWLHLAGGPSTPQTLGLTDEDIDLAVHYSHYLRKRFTIARLRTYLPQP